jgi:hypothetical protein
VARSSSKIAPFGAVVDSVGADLVVGSPNIAGKTFPCGNNFVGIAGAAITGATGVCVFCKLANADRRTNHQNQSLAGLFNYLEFVHQLAGIFNEAIFPCSTCSGVGTT